MNIDKEEAELLAEEIYNNLLTIPSRLMKHKCGSPISKETAIANIYLTLTRNGPSAVCTRYDNHEGPCNGLPRKDCPQLKV